MAHDRSTPPRFTRARLGAALLLLSVLASAPPVTATPANVEKDGWWNSLTGPQEVPGNLLTPVLPPPPTSVPSNAIAVGARAGDVDKVAAVGLLLDAELGSLVTDLEVTLREAPDRGAQINSDTANVVACPITTLWGPDRNGEWVSRPGFDCELGQVTGERSDDGTWKFDLSLMAFLWLDEDDPLDQNGFALTIDTSEGAETAQVSFLDAEAGGIEIAFEASPPLAEEDFEEEFEEPSEEFFFEPGFEEDFTFDTPVVEEPAPAPEAEIVFADRAQSNGRPIGDPNLWGNLPWFVLLVVPVLLAGGLAIAYVLGPAGNPDMRSMRTGAVSRALSKSGR